MRWVKPNQKELSYQMNIPMKCGIFNEMGETQSKPSFYIQQEKICPRCGEEVSEDFKFCPYCGQKIY